MADSGDVLQFLDIQEFFDQELMNVYYYAVSGGSITEAAAADLFTDGMITAVKACQSSSLVHTRVIVRNVSDLIGQAELTHATPIAGERGGEALPSFVAWAFRLNRATLSTRHGQKRIAGCAESDVQGNVPAAAFLSTLAAVANVMDNQLNPLTGTLLTPVIARLGAGGGVVQINPIDNASFVRVSSQKSRQQYS